jgi:AcrR family transcriptional regulator
MTARRTGRRTGDTSSRAAILDAARARFAERGYQATTIRAVAGAAGVDPALVHYFFGTKQGLFTAAMDLPYDPAEVVRRAGEGDPELVGERLATAVLELWDQPEAGERLAAMLRSAVTHEDAARLLREYFGREVLLRLAEAVGGPDAERRAGLLATQVVGLAMMRHVLKLEPIASMDADELAGWIGPTLQRYLTG